MDVDATPLATAVDEGQTARDEELDEEFEITPIGDFKTVPEATVNSIYGCR